MFLSVQQLFFNFNNKKIHKFKVNYRKTEGKYQAVTEITFQDGQGLKNKTLKKTFISRKTNFALRGEEGKEKTNFLVCNDSLVILEFLVERRMICDKKLRMLFLPFFFQVEYN